MFKYKVITIKGGDLTTTNFENPDPFKAKEDALRHARMNANIRGMSVQVFEIDYKHVLRREEVVSEKLIFDNSED